MRRTSRLVDKVIASLRGETAIADESKASSFQEALRMGQPTEEEKETFRGLLNEGETSKAKLLYHAPSNSYLKVIG